MSEKLVKWLSLALLVMIFISLPIGYVKASEFAENEFNDEVYVDIAYINIDSIEIYEIDPRSDGHIWRYRYVDETRVFLN